MLRVVLMAAVLGVPAAPEPAVETETSGERRTAAEPALPTEPRPGPDDTRLMFAPTGRPLRKGDGYFSDYELVFPGFAIGLTDNLSLAGGVSTIPGLGLNQQLAYFAPKIGFNLSDRVSVAVGGLIAGMGGDDDIGSLGIAYGVGTFGSPDHSLSLGFGAGRELGGHFAETQPILMVGGQTRLSRSVALVSENWLVLDGDTRLSEQPFGLALRIFGDRLSADIGVVLVGALLDEGFPLPWVSVTYRFGPARAARGDAPH